MMNIFGCLFLLSITRFAARATLLGDDGSSTRAEYHVRRGLDLSDQPTRLDNLIRMTITPNGPTSIDIELQNHFAKPAAILKWNTILENFLSESPRLQLSQKQDNRESFTEVGEIGNRVRAQYWRLYPGHFLVLAPQQIHRKTLDLRAWFGIEGVHEYSLMLMDSFRVIFGDGVDLTAIQRSDIPSLPHVKVVDSIRPLRLDANKVEGGLQTRALKGILCSPEQAAIIDRARTAAKVLAGFSHRNFNRGIWQEYFNGVDSVQNLVSNVYRKIENYTPIENIFKELCDSGNSGTTMTICVQGMIAFHVRGWTKEIIFCNEFFSDEVQRNKDCEACGPNGPYDMTDAPGTFLHELTHVEELVGRNIRDGNGYGCYDWKCTTEAASLRDAPRFDGRASPSPRHKETLEGLPEEIAVAYELYAYAIRAQACRERRWPEPQLSSRLAYCWTKIKSGCKKCTEIAQNAAHDLGSLIVGVPTRGLGMCLAGDQVFD